MSVPRHIAIIMDGNGRWAEQRGMPRSAGHRAGVKSVRTVIERCAERGVSNLTLFAFSSENWLRPKEEVGLLMSLFLEALDREIADLHKNNIRIRFIGNLPQLAVGLQSRIRAAEERTKNNSSLTVVIAVAYGGRWDITQAARSLAIDACAGKLDAATIDEKTFAERLALTDLPDPDIFVRTGGEQRISNFLLWNLAYTEFFFLTQLWPEFGARELDEVIDRFSQRERRYGLTSVQATASQKEEGP